MAEPSRPAILQAYRSLYKSCLYAVRYSHPSRNILRNQLRIAFRKSPAASFDSSRIKNTLMFLDGAGREAGLESKILKGLTEVQYWRTQQRGKAILKGQRLRKVEHWMHWGSYNATIIGLNDSMGMCLPTIESEGE